ncbi:TRAP transporter small permease subunit [Thalassotalea atypica]|uniref:TRAP transporter small permease subunit n=1 Tax=Thalassotalea atypica TaxID=2054316 RepID=UPI0025748657|nr:TRAP transporter small permease subunit [Thalassotalea atypica]
MKWLPKTIALIDALTEFLGRIIAWLTLVMVITMFAIVVLRYGFNIGWIAMQESVLYLHGIIFMLGAAYTLKADGHVRVDIFYHRFSAKQKAIVDLFGTILLLLPVTIFIFMISFDYVANSWHILEKSPEAGGLPFVYLGKSLLLVLAVTLALQGLAELARNMQLLLSSSQSQQKGNPPVVAKSLKEKK